MNCKDCINFEHETISRLKRWMSYERRFVKLDREVCHLYNFVIDGKYVPYKQSDECYYFIERDEIINKDLSSKYKEVVIYWLRDIKPWEKPHMKIPLEIIERRIKL